MTRVKIKKPSTAAARGFAALTPERRREIAAKGGRASHAAGTGHRWTKAEARRYGSIGGTRSGGGRGAVCGDGGACVLAPEHVGTCRSKAGKEWSRT